MSRSNLWLKLLGVAFLCALTGFYLYPPGKNLKLGIDLDGGYSLLYEVDDAGLDAVQKDKLADNVIAILKKRVDPDNVRNLVWRAIGNNRLEIQMPRPNTQILGNRVQFEEARDNLAATNVTVSGLYAILREEGAAREKSLNDLATYAPARKALIGPLAQAYDARLKAQQELTAAGQVAEKAVPSTQPQAASPASAQLQKAQTDLDHAIDGMLATNFPMQSLMDALEGGPGQAKVVANLSTQFPDRKPLIEPLAAAYDNWSKVKSGLDDPSDLQRLLRGAGVLEFRILVDQSDPDVAQYKEQLKERGPRIHKGDIYGWFLVQKPEEFRANGVTAEYGGKKYVLAYLSPEKGLLAGGSHPWKLVGARTHVDPQNASFAVSFQLDDWGGQLFSELTANNLHKPLCILLDGEAISAPNINSRIGSQGEITGNFTSDKAGQLSQILNAGALPARLKEPPLSIRSIGSTLGETNRNMGLRASYLGLIAVVVFMAVYYLFGGLIADVAVVINLLFTLGIMAALDATFTLPGVAGLILSVGMAVDSNVLIFERLREEAARGHPLRLALKYGYERAWRTIFDSHVVTLISCAILYYFGSEEIRGFALTLGLGLLANLFTAVFVTRWVFELLLSYNLLTRLPMLHLIRGVNIDWWGLRRYFLPVSGVLVVAGLTLYFTRDPKKLYDIEFLGGTSAQIELKTAGSMDDEQVREMVTGAKGTTAVTWLESAADAMDQAAKSGVSQDSASVYEVRAPKGAPVELTARQIRAFLEAVNSPAVEKGGIREASDQQAVTVAMQPSANINLDRAKAMVVDSAKYLRTAANKLSAAQVQTVREDEKDKEKPRLFEIVTTETNEYVVREALVAVSGDKLNVERAVQFVARPNNKENNVPFFPVTTKDLAEVLGDNTVPPTDVREYIGGVAMVMDDLKPAITAKNLDTRLREMRLQPDFEHYAWRQFQVIGLKQAGVDEKNNPLYASVAVVVVDPNTPFDEGRSQWEDQLAQPELQLTKSALGTERTLRKVVQFAQQVGEQTQQRAFVALFLALLSISTYIWIRFGSLRHGLGAALSLFHDVAIGMGAVAASYFIAYTSIGHALLVGDYKVNLTIMAALLTLVGYSLNDTIVVFDRIRENRGRLREITPQIMNASINQTMSRTLLTSLTVFMTVVILYIVGGPGIQGFAYVMTIGVIAGTYSSIAIASPLLFLFTKNRQGGSSQPRKVQEAEAK